MTIQDEPRDDLDEALKALASPVRRKILCQMRNPAAYFPGQEQPYELGVCAGAIDAACGLSQSTVSAHLAILLHAGLITGRRVGQFVFYKRNEAAIDRFLKQIGKTLFPPPPQ